MSSVAIPYAKGEVGKQITSGYAQYTAGANPLEVYEATQKCRVFIYVNNGDSGDGYFNVNGTAGSSFGATLYEYKNTSSFLPIYNAINSSALAYKYNLIYRGAVKIDSQFLSTLWSVDLNEGDKIYGYMSRTTAKIYYIVYEL